MSAELDSVLEVLKTMFTELADDLSDLRGDNAIVIERATERIREWFEVIAKARGLTSDKAV